MNGFTIALLSIFITALLVQLYFWLILFVKVLNFHKKTNSILEPVSVIIAAKNETTNLEKYLPLILNQNYPKFEIIVVLDQTTDNSENILEEYQKKHSNLKVLNSSGIGKKNALTDAIRYSTYNRLLFTDADCFPVSENWIRSMSACFYKNKTLVLGLGMYQKTNGLLNAFIRYDSQIIALQYLAAASSGRPYMGVGRNLAYTKQLWESNSGFDNHKDLISGDDDLFVLSAGTKNNTETCFSVESITLTGSKKNLSALLRQKSRHTTSSSLYDFRAKFFSAGEIISRTILFISFFALMFTPFIQVASVIIVLTTILQAIVLNKFSQKIKNNVSVFHVIIFGIFAPFFYGSLIIYKLLIYNKKEW